MRRRARIRVFYDSLKDPQLRKQPERLREQMERSKEWVLRLFRVFKKY